MEIVWNGVDRYITVDIAINNPDIDYQNGKVWTQTEEFEPFNVCGIGLDLWPVDDHGEEDIDHIYLVESLSGAISCIDLKGFDRENRQRPRV